MTRHLLGFMAAFGLLLFVVAGTWLVLQAGAPDSSAGPAGVAVVVGLALLIAGSIARGELRARLLAFGRLVGAIGLIVTAVAVALLVLGLLVGADIAGLVPWSLGGLAAWAVGASLASGLPYRASVAWLGLAVVAMAGVMAAAFVVATVVARMVQTDLRLADELATKLALAIGAAILGVGIRAWTARHPDRALALRGVGHLALGRAAPDERVVLSRGPIALLRAPQAARRPSPAPAESAEGSS